MCKPTLCFHIHPLMLCNTCNSILYAGVIIAILSNMCYTCLFYEHAHITHALKYYTFNNTIRLFELFICFLFHLIYYFSFKWNIQLLFDNISTRWLQLSTRTRTVQLRSLVYFTALACRQREYSYTLIQLDIWNLELLCLRIRGIGDFLPFEQQQKDTQRSRTSTLHKLIQLRCSIRREWTKLLHCSVFPKNICFFLFKRKQFPIFLRKIL